MDVSTYFYRLPKGADLSQLLIEHQKQFPGNALAVLNDGAGGCLVKVAYPEGTPLPKDAVIFADAKIEVESAAMTANMPVI